MPRAVILTSLPVEYLAVRSHLSDLQEEIDPKGTIYERGKFAANGQEWEVGIVETGAGNAGAAVEAERAISYFKPDILFFVGIAGGIKDVAIGDVVAATKVYGYESGKVSEQFSTRPAVGQSAYALVQRAKSEARKEEWLQRLTSNLTTQPRVFIAPIAAGEKVVASRESELFKFLRASYNDAIAVEMEGFGFLSAAFAYPEIKAIVIRGISDLIKDKNEDSPESGQEPEQIRHEKASYHASAFAFEILAKLRSYTESTSQSTTVVILNSSEEFQEYPVVIEDGTVYITSQAESQGLDGISGHSFDIQFTIEELTKENYHNLPVPSHKQLFGREKDLKDLLYRISPDFYERIITVAGIGGVGKTSLVLEAAYACLAAKKEPQSTSLPTFDVIVFSSAQLRALSPQGITEVSDIQRPVRTLQDLCFDIANTLKQSGLKVIDPNDQITALQDFLSRGDYRILIILDNLESIQNSDIHQIHEFLRKIRGHHVKTVITTRTSERYDVNLQELSETESLRMIENLLTEKGYEVDDDFPKSLNRICGGIPLAIHYSIGCMEIEKNYQKVLDKLSDPNCDLSQYCFDELVHDIANMYPMAYKLLVTLSVSPFGLTRENLFCLTKVSDSQLDEADDALNMLNRCSLVFHSDGYNRMLPITRKYALSKLEENSVLELEVRNSWVNCYLEIARTNGGEDFGEWHIRYDVINNEWKNFKEVFLWCQNHQKYPEASSLWKSLARFAYLYGYWTDRLEWTYWLTDNAFQRGDNAFLAELRSAWAWIALLREGSENLMKAEELLKSAWMLNKYCDPYIQNMIAINKAVLYTRKSDFLKADYWFGQYMELRKKNRNDLSQLHRDRLELRYLLYMGERYYRGGNYDRAKRLYKQVTKKSEGILWLRIKVKAFERIAYIAIKENRLEDAKELLDDWYLVTKRNNEFRRMAYFERDYAELEFKNENYDKAKEWANKALGKFLSLNMLNRVDAMKKFISKCNSHLK